MTKQIHKIYWHVIADLKKKVYFDQKLQTWRFRIEDITLKKARIEEIGNQYNINTHKIAFIKVCLFLGIKPCVDQCLPCKRIGLPGLILGSRPSNKRRRYLIEPIYNLAIALWIISIFKHVYCIYNALSKHNPLKPTLTLSVLIQVFSSSKVNRFTAVIIWKIYAISL